MVVRKYRGVFSFIDPYTWIPREFLFKSLKMRNVNENDAILYLIEILEKFYSKIFLYLIE